MKAQDEGVATVAAVALMAMLGAVAFLAVALGQQSGARSSLSAAADIAALVGAQSLDDPCSAAVASAAANRIELVDCSLEGLDVAVRVRRPMPPLMAHLLTWLGHQPADLTAVARAGPPDGPSD
jgi:secretion/DNA translocation related TadE-like protein